MQIHSQGTREFLPLTDSLASRIRWRWRDYEAMLRAQVELLLDSENHAEPTDRTSESGQPLMKSRRQ